MLNAEFEIDGRRVGAKHSPYVIAEAGSNHNQSKDIAFRLIDAAAEAGVDAVKFQLFRADALYPNGGELHDIFKSVELNADWLPDLKRHANDRNLHFSASAFDRGSIACLRELGVPFIKVASSEVTNLDLVARMAAIKVPLVISTGMCGMAELSDAIDICAELGVADVSILQCRAAYPLEPAKANLAAMDTLRTAFGGPVGFSDHSLGTTLSVAAAACGACVIEKHFTLDRKLEGPDHFYALEPGELKEMVAAIRVVHSAIGTGEVAMLDEERKVGRRDGLWLTRARGAAENLSPADLEIKRPAIGIKSRHAVAIAGAKLKRDVAAGAPLSWSDLDLT